MNYATALTLPSWTAEAQRYSYTAIRYTPIIFKAFNKSFTPQILATVKDLSLYYLECGKGAGKWAMTAAEITHNPLQAAFRSAHAELTSADAQATYRRIGHIINETVMDALVLGICGVVAITTTIEAAQDVYRRAVALYGKVQAQLKPAPVIVPTVEMAFAATSDEAIASMVEEVRYERYFCAQFDQLDSDVQLIVEEQVDEAIAQVTVAQLKSARAALVLQMEGDRLAREALAYVLDRAVAYAKAERVQVAAAPVSSAIALDAPGATGTPKRQRKAKAGTGNAEVKPKKAKAQAKVEA